MIGRQLEIHLVLHQKELLLCKVFIKKLDYSTIIVNNIFPNKFKYPYDTFSFIARSMYILILFDFIFKLAVSIIKH